MFKQTLALLIVLADNFESLKSKVIQCITQIGPYSPFTKSFMNLMLSLQVVVGLCNLATDAILVLFSNLACIAGW